MHPRTDLLAGLKMDFPELIIRNHNDLADAFAAIRTHLDLSNEFCEALGGLTKDHINKTLGPTREKRIGPRTFDIFCELFAIEFVPRVNPEARLRMQKRWERRNKQQVRVPRPHSISKELLERAKQIIFAKHTRKATLASIVARQGKGRQAQRRNGHNGHAAVK